jgi:hypothetical protein
MFLVRYELDLYMLFRRNSVFKGLNTDSQNIKKSFLRDFRACVCTHISIIGKIIGELNYISSEFSDEE